MNENYMAIPLQDITDLEKEIIKDGKIQVLPYSFYKDIPIEKLYIFMHRHAVYVLPTTELITWLKENIKGSAIEIGAGNGCIGRALNIPMVDNKMQTWPEIIAYYTLNGQPVITYGDDVIEMEGLLGVAKYCPETVIGAFITHKYDEQSGTGNAYGINERVMSAMVDRYIMIGSLETHKYKPLLKMPHQQYFFDWLITRSIGQEFNRIFVWDFE